MLSNSGSKRLAISASIVWLLLFYFFTEKDENIRIFLLFGLLPVLAGWLFVWANKGFKQQQKNTQKKWLFRLTWWKKDD